jgi:hypothetical protein
MRLLKKLGKLAIMKGDLEKAKRLYGAYGDAFIRRITAMGIRDCPISARPPWQNGLAERPIGSIRRDCFDHVVIFNERHLRHLLSSYKQYYNESSTHPIARQGRADSAPHPERRARACLANLRRSSPSIRSSLNIRQVQWWKNDWRRPSRQGGHELANLLSPRDNLVCLTLI